MDFHLENLCWSVENRGKWIHEDQVTSRANCVFMQCPHVCGSCINRIEYVLHQANVRAQAKICVPLSLMATVGKATHAFAHPGVDKTVPIMDKRCKFTVPKRQWSNVASAVVEGCPVCQATKHRRGTQPEFSQAYPIAEYPVSSVSIYFFYLTSDPCTQRNTEYVSVLVLVCRLTGYVIAVPCQNF